MQLPAIYGSRRNLLLFSNRMLHPAENYSFLIVEHIIHSRVYTPEWKVDGNPK